MSKKIDAALRDLTKALNKHADIVGSSAVSLKKAERAAAKVAAAATAYAEAVHIKSGMANPFDDMLQPGLDDSTVASLEAERDRLAERLTGPVPMPEQAVRSRSSAVPEPEQVPMCRSRPSAGAAALTRQAVASSRAACSRSGSMRQMLCTTPSMSTTGISSQ